MPTALFSIGRSGLVATRSSLELTAQNVANAASPDYARRSLGQSELVGNAIIGFSASDALGGVRIADIMRAQSALVQRQVRDTASSLASTSAEARALREAETALERSRLYGGIVDFEASLTRLESDPTNQALRISALESARQMAGTFSIADTTLDNARRLTIGEAEGDVGRINTLAEELARVNRQLVAARDGSAGKASLLDARDAALRGLSEILGFEASFSPNGTVNVTLDGTPALSLVDAGTAASFALSVAADGTLSFAVDGAGFVPASGAMAGRMTALSALADLQIELDDLAASVIALANNAQASGAALDGTPGQPLFAGTGAADIAVVLASGAGLATAPAGSPAGSRDTGNLAALIAALGSDTGPAATTNTMLLTLSSRIAGLELRREGLGIVLASAEAELQRETGVDLETEAANLIRLQRAFEANSRVIQVASNIFDTLLGLR
jgi:flagellar hook-associated protein 1 FlgK